MLKAKDLLDDYKKIDFGCNVDELHNEIDIAIKELQKLEKNETIVRKKYDSLSDAVVSCLVEDDIFKYFMSKKMFDTKNFMNEIARKTIDANNIDKRVMIDLFKNLCDVIDILQEVNERKDFILELTKGIIKWHI